MKLRWLAAILFTALIAFVVYLPPAPRKINRSFYYWKQAFRMDDNDQKLFDTLNVNTIYVRAMDIDHRELAGAVPVSVVSMYDSPPFSCKLIPTVFITNRTFQNMNNDASRQLAYKVHDKLTQLFDRDNYNVKELQIDCDWNSSTREKYFIFLQTLNDINEIPISATIRLHQVKHQNKTGVPPVQKGLLMFYNMSPVAKDTSLNSILDMSEAKKYLSKKTEYPLPLDVGLPVFCWSKAFRGNKFLGLMNYTGEAEIAKLTYFQREEKNKYRCTADTVHGEIYFRKGDVVRVEEPTAEQLYEAAELTSSFIDAGSMNVAFYHWDTTLINKYGHEVLSDIYDRYR